MEDDQKNQNGRQPENKKWKTTKKFKMEDKKNHNGRRPKQFKTEDDQKIKIKKIK